MTDSIEEAWERQLDVWFTEHESLERHNEAARAFGLAVHLRSCDLCLEREGLVLRCEVALEIVALGAEP